jgi:type II secretory pathway pseudopilin PulG
VVVHLNSREGDGRTGLGGRRGGSGPHEGFTLVELMVILVVAGLISVAVIMAFSNMSGVFHSQGARIQNQDDARTAINEITRYIRMATSSVDNMTSQSNAIATALPQDIEFYCDIDGDGTAEKVRYHLSGTTLYMQTAEPQAIPGAPYFTYPAYETNGLIIQDAVRNGAQPIFTYYYLKADGTLQEFAPATDADRQAVVTVAVSLIVNERPDLAKGNVELATEVQIRQRYLGGIKQ